MLTNVHNSKTSTTTEAGRSGLRILLYLLTVPFCSEQRPHVIAANGISSSSRALFKSYPTAICRRPMQLVRTLDRSATSVAAASTISYLHCCTSVAMSIEVWILTYFIHGFVRQNVYESAKE